MFTLDLTVLSQRADLASAQTFGQCTVLVLVFTGLKYDFQNNVLDRLLLRILPLLRLT